MLTMCVALFVVAQGEPIPLNGVHQVVNEVIGAKLGFFVLKQAWEAIPFDYSLACTIHSQLSFQLILLCGIQLYYPLSYFCMSLPQTARTNEIVSTGYTLLGTP